MIVFETERLRARPFVASDAPFVLDLVTQPSWRANIGDRGVRQLDEARAYIADRLRPSYASHGYGFWCIERSDGAAMGLCGLVQRPALPAPDLGFAFLPAFWGQGYAREAAAATVRVARDRGLTRLLAIATPENAPSIRVLEHVGMTYRRTIRMPGDDADVSLYERRLDRQLGAIGPARNPARDPA